MTPACGPVHGTRPTSAEARNLESYAARATPFAFPFTMGIVTLAVQCMQPRRRG